MESSFTREQWEERRTRARLLMTERSAKPSVLIEVSSQHPLLRGVEPDVEFAARLLFGKELYMRVRAEGKAAEIVVSGSRHRDGDTADSVSLSMAAKTFLTSHGVSEGDIRGEDLMARYKGDAEIWPGVYNSADEAYVASSYFKDVPDFGRLHCVVGPAQLHRKALHYLWMGVYPLMHAVPVDNTYHDYLKEAFDFIPFVLATDPSHQEPDSKAARSSRERRVPR